MPVDAADFRHIMGQFVTGVAIVTTFSSDAKPVGLTVNSLTSVSLDPPGLLFCLDKKSSSLTSFLGTETFAVHFLSESQEDLSNLFASKNPEKFEGLAWETGTLNTPVIKGCMGVLECERKDIYPGGDHMILLGLVENIQTGQGEATPLLFFSGQYRNMKI